jgi:hypothetical protein
MTTRRRRRRGPRLYLRGHLGCLGCSIPLLAFAAVLAALLVLLQGNVTGRPET